jgi:hypothetical protein
LLCKIPFIGDATAQAIYPFIVLPPAQYREYLQENLTTSLHGILVHEATHLIRQKEQGFIVWAIKYLCIPSFRYSEELEAIRAQMRVYVRAGEVFDTSLRAHSLSSALYLWMIHTQKAQLDLDYLWSEITSIHSISPKKSS